MLGWRGRLTVGITFLVVLILVIYPLTSLILRAFVSDGQLSLNNFYKVLSTPANYTALYNSLFVSVISTVFATILGTLLAWIVARTNVPFRRQLRTALLMPFLVPPFIAAMAWLQIIGPAGYINRIYMAVTGGWDPLFVIYGKWAVILVMTLSGYPFVYLTNLGGLERMNPDLEEAGQASGARLLTVMKDITLPLMAPTIAAGAVLVFVSRIANFGIPAVMGLPANYFVLTTRIYRLVDQSFAVKDAQAMATAMSIFLVIIAAAGLLLAKSYLKNKEYAVISGKSVHPKTVDLGRLRHLFFAFCLGVVIIAAVLPVIAIILTALTKAWGLLPTLDNLTLENFRYVLFDLRQSQRAIRNSVFLAVTAATATTLIGIIIAYVVIKTGVRGRKVLDVLGSMPYSVPGTVFALGMIVAWNRAFWGRFNIYNTIWILLIAYIARYLAFSLRTVSASLRQVDSALEESARVSGASWLQTLKDIVLPLIRPGIAASWFLVLMPTLRELTISIMLWSAGNETIGVVVFNLQSAGQVTASAALATIMIAAILLVNAMVKRLTGGKYGY